MDQEQVHCARADKGRNHPRRLVHDGRRGESAELVIGKEGVCGDADMVCWDMKFGVLQRYSILADDCTSLYTFVVYCGSAIYVPSKA